MNFDKIIEELQNSRSSISKLEVASKPGVYAVFMVSGVNIPLIECPLMDYYT